jgi:hypothetical protein
MLRGGEIVVIVPRRKSHLSIDTRRLMVQYQELELAVGEVFYLGDTTVTVIDIEYGEVTFRVDDGETHDDHFSNILADSNVGPLPR